MPVTPLIRPLRTSGGTFYTFTSAGEDLTLSLSNTERRFRFSRFALLNLPARRTATNQENYLRFDAVQSVIGETDADDNVNLAESFQNYCLNLEALLASRDEYDQQLPRTVSERVFFKWLKELGAIRWREAEEGTERTTGLAEARFAEETSTTTGSQRYQRVVQYLGEITETNTQQSLGSTFTEVYLHVPNLHGNTPLPLFRTLSDQNYPAGLVLTHLPTNPADAEFIVGRDAGDVHPQNLSLNAFFDQDVAGGLAATQSGTTINGSTGNWFDALGNFANSYFTESTFTNTANDALVIDDGTTQVNLLRNRLDGVTLDFDPASYAPLTAQQATARTLDAWNASAEAGSFEFNAVLVYYDLVDPTEPQNTVTNLYGVFFLDDFDPASGGGSIIVPRPKFKANEVGQLTGDSWALRLNLKFDVSTEGADQLEIITADHHHLALDVFLEASQELLRTSRLLQHNQQQLVSLSQQVADLQNLLLTSTSNDELLVRLVNLEEQLLTARNVFETNESTVELINRVYQQVLDLVNNNTSLEISYNLDVLRGGEGIFIDRSVPNQVTLRSQRQAFNLGTTPALQLTLGGDNTVPLRQFTNYLRHTSGGSQLVAPADTYLYLNDTDVRWKRGQVLRLVIADPVIWDGFSLIILTDAPNRLRLGSTYGVTVAVLDETQLRADGTGTFELVCLDENSLTFAVDKLS